MIKIFLFLLLLTACSDKTAGEISPAELKQGDLILDVRTAAEHDAASLAQEHWLVPLNQLDAAQFIREHKLDGTKPLYILCRSGKRAKTAAEKFKQAGFKNVVVIRGGIIAAQKEGIAVR
ncbi:MAG: rhodanese-like domain-containing protein [Alphaproteobacteria bacterium]|nr:rhodanese-like domain-containing protein [Alphaproteobacteria bacterium]